MPLQLVRRHVELRALDRVRVRDDAAEQVARRPGNLRQQVRDEPARARLRGRDGDAPGDAPGLEPPGELDERVVPHRQVRLVRTGGFGGANSHVSGLPLLDIRPRFSPLRVKYVALDLPVRTSTESRAVNVSTLPGS